MRGRVAAYMVLGTASEDAAPRWRGVFRDARQLLLAMAPRVDSTPGAMLRDAFNPHGPAQPQHTKVCLCRSRMYVVPALPLCALELEVGLRGMRRARRRHRVGFNPRPTWKSRATAESGLLPGSVATALHGRFSMYILYVHRSSLLLIMRTRIFKSGNSLAVRIPKELAIAGVSEEVEIERVGNTLVLRPAQRPSLADLPEIFASFPKSFMAGGREFHEQREREWDIAEPSAKD